ncbi:MAG: hypothetical protein ACRDOD_09925, partial [Streptosporangiaceae bacterium]
VVHRITPAPVDCVHAAAVSCLETDDNGPTLTADGRVLYLHSGAMVTYGCGVYYCGGGSTVGNQYTIGSDVGGDQPNTWPTGPPDSWSAPATQGGYAFSPAADPADAQLIAYPGFEDPASPSWTVNPLVIDDDAALSPFVVSDDDVTQSAVTWSPDGSYVLDIEGGANPGIWAYTARPYTATGWKAYYVLAPPPQTAEGGGLGNGLAITGDGRVLFTSGHEIYSLPSGCGPVGDAAAPTTGTPIPNCTLAQATQLTTDASSEEPTWTALTTLLSYTPPTTPGPPVPPLPPGRLVPPVPPLPPVPPQHPDELRSVGLAQRTVRSGAPVTFEVRLGASSKIVVEILRLVPASGHGRHRHRARYRLVGTDTFAGKHGLDRLRVIKLHGRRLAPGGYEARVSAGGRAHVVKFKVRR